MKKAFVNIWVVLAILFIVCGGCKQRSPKKLSYTPGWMVLPDSISLLIQGEEQNSEDEESYYVSLSHQWKDLDDSVFLSSVPSPKIIEKWKKEFESANPADSVWKTDIARFEDAEHYLAVTDFIELWHRVAADIDVAQTEWRLLQWDPDPTSIPEGGFAKVTHLRELFESLMCYDTGSQWDMTFYAWLWTDFMGFYNKVLRREIGKRVNQDNHLTLKKEASARERFYWKESAAFQKMDGDSLGGGSSFPYRVGMFGKESLEAEAKANEIFLFTLMEKGRLMEVPQGFEPNVVLQEYTRFADVLEHKMSRIKERQALIESGRLKGFYCFNPELMDEREFWDLTPVMACDGKCFKDNSIKATLAVAEEDGQYSITLEWFSSTREMKEIPLEGLVQQHVGRLRFEDIRRFCKYNTWEELA